MSISDKFLMPNRHKTTQTVGKNIENGLYF